MRKIDVFTHIFPTRYVERMMDLASTMKDVGKRVRNVPMLANLDVRFEIMDAHPELSAGPLDCHAAGRGVCRCERCCRSCAACERWHGGAGREISRSISCVHRVAADERRRCDDAELERAMGSLRARGIQICSNIQGKPLDLPEYQPIFAAMASHDLPIWLHPYRSADIADYPTEDRSLYEIWWTLRVGRTRSSVGHVATGVLGHLRSTSRTSRSSRTTWAA